MRPARSVIPLLLAGLVLVFAFTAVYVAAFHAPHPRGVDVGVVGGPAQTARLQGALDAGAPGAFDVERFDTRASAQAALLDTGVSAVLLPGAGSDRILVAGALGMAPAETAVGALRRVAVAAHARTGVEDLRPLPAADRRGLSPLFTVVGTLIPSLVFGVLLAVLGRALPARARWTAVFAFAIGAGLLAALNVGVIVGALEHHFLALAAVTGLLALAVGAAAYGLARLGGPPGIATAVLVLLLVGLSSSGGAVTHDFEPGFYGAVSQWLPPGAALTAVRNVAYFDSAAITEPLLVLGAWATAGLTLGALADIPTMKGRQQ